jgi:hypothetical protein
LSKTDSREESRWSGRLLVISRGVVDLLVINKACGEAWRRPASLVTYLRVADPCTT